MIAQNCKCSSAGEWTNRAIFTQGTILQEQGENERMIQATEKMNLKNIIPGQKMPDTKDIITCETLQKINL